MVKSLDKLYKLMQSVFSCTCFTSWEFKKEYFVNIWKNNVDLLK